MVQESSCPPEMIFDTRVQACNWQGDTHQAVCEELASFEKDAACQCEYARTLCTRSLGDLTAETISTWEFPTDCAMADDICPTECAVTDDICSAGDKLYQEHKSDVCTWCIQPSCENGSPQSQSCIDQSTHCCGGLLPVCQCDVIEAECERGNGKSCSMYADICCNDDACKCDHKTKSCSLSLESSSNEPPLLQDCLDAEKTCCTDCRPLPVPAQITLGQDIGSCQCSCKFWDQLCESNPGPACLLYSGRCCGSPDHVSHNDQCYCEMGDYLENHGYPELDYKKSCAKAREVEFLSHFTQEKESLINLFNQLGGLEWKQGRDTWLNDETEHCDWFGVKCDSNTRYIVELDLTGNNLIGTMKSRLFAPFSKLESLVLAGNQLKGALDFNSFYSLRRLKHVDMSNNHLSGEVDVLLSPAMKHLNLSHNNLTSLVNFKFRGSQTTLEKLDLSHNGILQDIVHILQSIPANLKELVLAENHIRGSLPNPLPVLSELYRFILTKNNMVGRIPDLSRSFPRLQELDLSQQRHANNEGLSGPIPTGWINLPDLFILDLSPLPVVPATEGIGFVTSDARH